MQNSCAQRILILTQTLGTSLLPQWIPGARLFPLHSTHSSQGVRNKVGGSSIWHLTAPSKLYPSHVTLASLLILKRRAPSAAHDEPLKAPLVASVRSGAGCGNAGGLVPVSPARGSPTRPGLASPSRARAASARPSSLLHTVLLMLFSHLKYLIHSIPISTCPKGIASRDLPRMSYR